MAESSPNLNNPSILTADEFALVVRLAPLVSIDLLVTTDCRRVLLGLRKNAPARGFWFTPGGRIRKNESQADCVSRLIDTELGMPEISPLANSLIGAWDHFYQDSFFSNNCTTHYVNLVYLLPCDGDLDLRALPLDQHTQWRWWPLQEARNSQLIHPHVKPYLDYL